MSIIEKIDDQLFHEGCVQNSTLSIIADSICGKAVDGSVIKKVNNELVIKYDFDFAISDDCDIGITITAEKVTRVAPHLCGAVVAIAQSFVDFEIEDSNNDNDFCSRIDNAGKRLYRTVLMSFGLNEEESDIVVDREWIPAELEQQTHQPSTTSHLRGASNAEQPSSVGQPALSDHQPSRMEI